MGAGLKRARAAARATRPKPYRSLGARFGILNAYGDIWTLETFESEAGARAYIEKAAADWAGPGLLRTHEVVPVRVTVSLR